MGLEDRDWYRKAYKEKEQKYGSDFSGNNRQKNSGVRTKPRKEPVERSIFSTVFSSTGSYSTMRLGSDASDSKMMNVLGICPRCHNCFPVKVLKTQLYRFEYTCPECNQVVNIKGKKQKSIGARIALVLLAIVALSAAILTVGYLGNFLHDQLFPKISLWFLETFGAYL